MLCMRLVNTVSEATVQSNVSRARTDWLSKSGFLNFILNVSQREWPGTFAWYFCLGTSGFVASIGGRLCCYDRREIKRREEPRSPAITLK